MPNAGLKTITMIFSLFAPNFGQETVQHADDDIIVLARRMLALNIEYSLNGPFLDTCRIKPTSGDEAIDAMTCQLVKLCVGQGNMIPDNVERCLRTTLSDIKSGRSKLKLSTAVAARPTPSPKRLPEAKIVGIQPEKPAETPRQVVSEAPDITVVAPKPPKPGRWRFVTLTTSLNGSGASPPPQSREQCVVAQNTAKILESMLSSPQSGEDPGCRLNNLRIADGRIHARRICIDRAGRSAASIDGRYDLESIMYREDEERVDMSRGADGGNDRAVLRITTGEHIGDC